MPLSLFAALPRRAPSDVTHTAQNLASLLTAAGYLDVRARVDGYPSPRLLPEVLDLPDVTAIHLGGKQEVFYVLADSHLAGSPLQRPWRTLIAGYGPHIHAWLVVPVGRRPEALARLAALNARAHVLEL